MAGRAAPKQHGRVITRGAVHGTSLGPSAVDQYSGEIEVSTGNRQRLQVPGLPGERQWQRSTDQDRARYLSRASPGRGAADPASRPCAARASATVVRAVEG